MEAQQSSDMGQDEGWKRMEMIESFKVHVEAYPFQKGSVCGS